MTSFTESVRVVGAGLLGTSIGLALTKQGVDVAITSQSAKSVELAVEYGAGRKTKDTDLPNLIVVCVPPQLTAKIVAKELADFPEAIVTDVASVKQSILDELIQLGAPVERYVGSHPMAGRERGGAIAGRADLEAKLLEASAMQPQPELHIRSHAKAKYEAVALVMASAQRLGLNKLGIVGSEQFVN